MPRRSTPRLHIPFHEGTFLTFDAIIDAFVRAKSAFSSLSCRVVINHKAEFLLSLTQSQQDMRIVNDFGYRILVDDPQLGQRSYIFSSRTPPETAFAQVAGQKATSVAVVPLKIDPAPIVAPTCVFELEALAHTQPHLAGVIDYKRLEEHSVCLDEHGHQTRYDLQASGLRIIYKLSTKSTSFASGHGVTWSGDAHTPVQLQEFAEEWQDSAAFLAAPMLTPGLYTCLFNPLVTGFFVHECVGHLFESDFYPYAGMFPWQAGAKVAAPCVTIVDDPTIGRPLGYYLFDAEGAPARRVVLIDKGRFSETLGRAPGCHARSKQHFDVTRVRMANTFMEPGDATLEDLLRLSPDPCLWIDSVNWGTGINGFKLMVRKAHLLRGGRKTPVRAHLVTSESADCLQRIRGVSRDFASNSSIFRGCSKIDQSELPVACGGAHILIDGLYAL